MVLHHLRIPHIPTFKRFGELNPYEIASWANNSVIVFFNGLIDLSNTGLVTVQVLAKYRPRKWAEIEIQSTVQMFTGIGKSIGEGWKYLWETPVDQATKDGWQWISEADNQDAFGTFLFSVAIGNQVIKKFIKPDPFNPLNMPKYNFSNSGGQFVDEMAGLGDEAGIFLAPDGKYYSTAFRTKLPNRTYPGGSYALHFKSANKRPPANRLWFCLPL